LLSLKPDHDLVFFENLELLNELLAKEFPFFEFIQKQKYVIIALFNILESLVFVKEDSRHSDSMDFFLLVIWLISYNICGLWGSIKKSCQRFI